MVKTDAPPNLTERAIT